jgi:hypothetical protein
MARTSVAAQTTEVGVLGKLDRYWEIFVGSVLAANGTLTTLEINCDPRLTALCSTYAGFPVYLTLGPTTQGLSQKPTSVSSGPDGVYREGWTERCEITSSTQGALCETTLSGLWSNQQGTTRTTYSMSEDIPASAMITAKLKVTGGVDLLSTPATTPAAKLPSHTGKLLTSTSIPVTKAHTPMAWVAGPVIGAFAGGLLIIGMAIWYLKWRTTTKSTFKDNPSGKKECKPGLRTELPGLNNLTDDHPPKLDRAELSGRTIYEAP